MKALICAALLVGLSGFPASDLAAQTAETPAAAKSEPAPEAPPSTIPIASIATEAVALDKQLREIATDLESAKLEKQVEAELPQYESDLASRQKALAALESREGQLSGLPTDLRAVEMGWGQLDKALEKEVLALEDRAGALDAWVSDVTSKGELWDRTRAEARKTGAPAAVIRTLDERRGALKETSKKLVTGRNTALELEAQLGKLRDKVTAARHQLEEMRQSRQAKVLTPQEAPIWALEFEPGQFTALKTVPREIGRSIASYARRSHERLVVHVLIILGLVWGIRRARGVLVAAEGEDRAASRALDRPVEAAVLFSVSLTWILHPEATSGFRLLVAAIAVPVWVIVLRGLLPPALHRPMYGLAGLVVVTLTYRMLGDLPVLSRMLLIFQTALGLLGVLWLRRPANLAHVPPLLRGGPWLSILGAWLPIVLLGFGGGLLATLLGYRNLAVHLVNVSTVGSFIAAAFVAAVRISEELLRALVVSRRLERLHIVDDIGYDVLRTSSRGLRAFTFLGWAYVVLLNLGLWDRLRTTGGRILSADIGYGPLQLSLGGIVAFGLTLWISWTLARFVSFVLDHEVFPHVRLAPGVPFALRTFTRYAILVLGFVTAMSVIGFSLDRVTLLVSALGVGIGFGLQNVVNNFVSGAILLFERPVRVGDRVELVDLLGIVTSIGLRASKVRTFDGSDVIVPNGDFISARVINWTLADQKRRIILPVGVAYGTEPEHVLEILRRVAHNHQEVLDEPEPESLFRGFGDNSLDFELRAWTESKRGWMPVMSDLGVAINRALKDADIVIPFPQRDLHLRSIGELKNVLTETKKGDDG